MPVRQWEFPWIWTAVGIKVVVFVATDGADLEVADIDVGDVYLAGVSGDIGRFGHGVVGPNERGSMSVVGKSNSFGSSCHAFSSE